MLTSALAPGNLVRWRNGPSGNVGVVQPREGNGHRVSVRFDSGEELEFAWPTDALERLRFEPGAQVESIDDHQLGVVAGAIDSDGLLLYRVNLPGAQTTMVESGLRPGIVTDAASLLRSGNVSSARSCNLRLTAARLLLAHQFDDLSSLSNSRVEIKPHQVAVLHRVASTYPHRFLLADEVGLGKTIEAGLIIKELKARGVVTRTLILAPSGIVTQWQVELKTKFNQTFSQYRRDSIAFLQTNSPGENVWTLNDNVITSTSYASLDEKRQREIAMAGWDLVVIDEAHHARRQWEGASRYSETKLYQLAEMLADPDMGKARAMLFLTATPMQLSTFELYSLVELLDPALFPGFPEFERHRQELAGLNSTVDGVRRWNSLPTAERQEATVEVIKWLAPERTDASDLLQTAAGRQVVTEELLSKHRLSEVMIRNRKAVVGGFMPRSAAIWPVHLSAQELEAYNATTDYVRTGYARSRALRNNALGFLMAIFQKLNSSSTYALRQSLMRRIEKLESGIRYEGISVDVEDDEIEEKSVSDGLGDLLAVERADTVQEIRELARIVGLLDGIQVDSKLQVLLDRLRELIVRDPLTKVIIFTQFRDSQEYIARHLDATWHVGVFHGQLRAADKDQVIDRFREASGPAILISTEAGGEGRNFQFCHILLNYDLPWNPMKIEQRIGRLDRIGQQHPVTIINFSIVGTIEERVLEVLSRRIRLFEETIGGLDPILGDIEENLKDVFLQGEKQAKAALDRLDTELESRVLAAREAERRLADLIMDVKSFRQDEVRKLLDRQTLVDTDMLRRFALASLQELGSQADEDAQVPGVYNIRLRGQFLNEYPQFGREGASRRATFDPNVARQYESVEFFAFGHEIVDTLIERALSRTYGGRTSARTIHTEFWPPTEGWFFTYTLSFGGVGKTMEVFPIFIHRDGRVDPVLSDWLLDHASSMKREEWDPVPLPPADGAFERAVAAAEIRAKDRLLARQAELSAVNQQRLEQEKSKVHRLYDYRTRAAAEKLVAVGATLERIRNSPDQEVQRIIPIWSKNLENARRTVQTVESDRVRRLAELEGTANVTAKQDLLTASYVQIVPAVAP